MGGTAIFAIRYSKNDIDIFEADFRFFKNFMSVEFIDQKDGYSTKIFRTLAEKNKIEEAYIEYYGMYIADIPSREIHALQVESDIGRMTSVSFPTYYVWKKEGSFHEWDRVVDLFLSGKVKTIRRKISDVPQPFRESFTTRSEIETYLLTHFVPKFDGGLFDTSANGELPKIRNYEIDMSPFRVINYVHNKIFDIEDLVTVMHDLSIPYSFPKIKQWWNDSGRSEFIPFF